MTRRHVDRVSLRRSDCRRRATLEPERFLPDRFELHGSDLHLLYPNGSGRSKMTLDYFEKRLDVKGTARNLNTVAKLIELSAR